MARVLVVGCGCRGAGLARSLLARGHAVRGTTRNAAELARIEAAGADGVVADPGRLATLVPQVEGVGVVCWLMGTADGAPDDVAALHGPRLGSMLETIVDAPVRGFVYEGAGPVPARMLERGAAIARRAERANRIPVEVLEAAPGAYDRWLGAAITAVDRVLAR